MIVRSSHGEFQIDETGRVLDWRPFDECSDETRREYGAIERFDLAEYRAAYPNDPPASCFDILDLAFVNSDGTREAADPQFRADVREAARHGPPVVLR